MRIAPVNPNRTFGGVHFGCRKPRPPLARFSDAPDEMPLPLGEFAPAAFA